ncbi:MAG: hypothetical protein EZS28_006491 [Streblomastix strix]|uniref:DDE-1 domain-containing protein n=1 Tax=Streblomastix strix TaxID=222440 RepID=A0A5J4WSG4_9EUKA|nr:MAG: hypothetical protein EZS28_006491 [Streblomastix strix]
MIKKKQLAQTILKKSDERQPMSHVKIKEAIEDINSKSPSDGVVRRLVDRNSDILESADAKPIENGRANVKKGDIRKYEDILEQEVVGLPPDVIYCTNKSGIQFFVDARSKKVLMRLQNDATEVNIPINRNEPKMSLLGAISLICEAIPLLPILKGTQWDDKWILSDVTAGIHADFTYIAKSYITIPVWEGWLGDRFVPAIDAARERLGTPHMLGVLLYDNHSTHCGEYARQFLANNNIKLITIPLHSSYFMQVLDVVSFGILKRQINKMRDIQGNLPLHDIIIHAINAYGAATTFLNC